MYDLIIVGSGPAGLSAGVYAKRASLDVLVLEKAPFSGGQILNTDQVDNYLGLPGMNGFELGGVLRSHADQMGVPFEEAEVLQILSEDGIKKVVTSKGVYETKSIIVSTGASHKVLNVPGEEKLSGKGVSYCATCDGAFFKNGTVAVVGGGDTALADAIYLSEICKKVILIHRRDKLRGAASLQQILMSKPNVEIHWNMGVTKISGNGFVQEVTVKDMIRGDERPLSIDGIFIAVGIRPETDILKGLVELTEDGFVVAGEDCKTSDPAIFVAGDLRTKPLRQIITAAADGANAVDSACAFLSSLN